MSRFCFLLSLCFFLTSCADNDYLRQSINGHWELMQRQRPIATLINDDATSPALKKQLFSILEIRQFAVTELSLPDNDSYRSYADIQRPYVLWNVVAAPEFSLRPKQWCYPIVGCFPYRGYYRRSDADHAARVLKRQGYDVTLYGVPAYSTLKWFDDPILSTFGLKSPDKLAALIFHELAHQKIHISDDSRFNEAFAVCVEEEGVSRYLDHLASPLAKKLYLQKEQKQHQTLALLRKTQQTLKALYARPMPYKQKRAEKKLILRQMQSQFQELQRQWGRNGEIPLNHLKRFNNARLASISTYYELVPGFRTLFTQEGRDFNRFYQSASQIAELSQKDRYQLLTQLAVQPSTPWRTILATFGP